VAKPGRVGPLASWLSYESAPTRLAWSPAGDRIAFEKRTGAIEILSLGRVSFSTEVVHADHGATTELDDWSPDGRALLFVRDFQVFVLDVETGTARYLSGGAHAVWSPDGLEIAIASGRNIYGSTLTARAFGRARMSTRRSARSPGRRTRHVSPSSAR
jgi:dipeptidyl aminopeptidase/acylaminoacyl peptidase